MKMDFTKYSPPCLPKNITSNRDTPLLTSSTKQTHFDGDLFSLAELVPQMSQMSTRSPSAPLKTPNNDKYFRKSTAAGYLRAYMQYSPATEATITPSKACLANLQNVIIDAPDAFVDICIWVVNLSEQFFYDNTLILLNGSKSDKEQAKTAIRNNCKVPDMDYFEKLENIIFLGKGAFGKVYRCTDPRTQKRYAIKYIAPESKNFIEHCKKILNYMAERNSVIRAMNSPFVVDFYYSFQTKSVGGLFLFFEYCIGDLYSYITGIAYDNYEEIATRLEKHEPGLIPNLDKGIDVLNVSLMYVFELFCGLDFLTKSNIVHQDIKPDNLMISTTLHLKIADFGLVYRTRAIHRQSNKLLVAHKDIDNAESSNYRLAIEGTYFYQDFEIKLLEMEGEENPFLEEVLNRKDIFDSPGISFKDENLKPTFLTDTWAAGVVSVNLLLRGFDIFDPALLGYANLEAVPQADPNEFLVHLVGRQTFYQSYIYGGLTNAGGETYRELMEFLASIFQPRQTRCKDYVKEKTIYKFSEKRLVKYIDMNKVAKIKSFNERNFECSNIFLFTVPEKIRKYFTERDKSVFPNFRNLLRGFSRTTAGQNVIDLTPGVIINYFH